LFGNKPAGTGTTPAPAAGSGTATGGSGGGLFSNSGTTTGGTGGTTTGGTTTGGTATGGGLFSGGTAGGATGTAGATQQKPADGIKGQSEIATATRMNMTTDELLRSWKKDLDSQVDNFQVLSKGLTQHIVDCYKNVDTIKQLDGVLTEMGKEFGAIQYTLDGIDKGQDNLYQKLDIIEQELQNYLYPEQNRALLEGTMTRTDLINKARRMNNELFQIEDEMSNLVGEMNQPLDEKDPTQLTENVLNNYYDALQFIESETIKSMGKLNQIENLLSNP
jgi:hypothetical protein